MKCPFSDLGGKAFLIALILVLVVPAVSSTYLINSNDWEDVYSGMRHSYGDNRTPYAIKNPNMGVLNIVPYGDPINVLSSEGNPVVSNPVSRLEAADYTVGNSSEYNSFTLDLMPEGEQDIVIVPEDYPAASLIASNYAEVNDAWVVIVNQGNLLEVNSLIDDEGEVTMIGDFNREISDVLSDQADQQILSPNKFNLSVKVAKETLKQEDFSRVYLTSGDFINKDVVRGQSPVLISGTNFVPESVEEFLLEDPQHGIDSAVVLGPQMTSVAQDLSDMNITRNGETTSEQIGTFIKYGQARGDSNQIYAISQFPLPTGELHLSIPRASYDPEEDRLFIKYRNNASTRMYQLTSFRIIQSGQTIARGGDEESVFIGGNSNRTIGYDVNLSSSDYENSQIEFSTTYGPSPSQLDTYLTEAGTFSPPLTKELAVAQINDESNLTVKSVKYLENLDRFAVQVQNSGDVPAYGQVRLRNVMITGESNSFSTEQEQIMPGEQNTFYIAAELDRIDLQENEEIDTILTYGEDQGTLVNSRELSEELEVESGIPPAALAGAGLLLLILVVAYLKRDKLTELYSSDSQEEEDEESEDDEESES